MRGNEEKSAENRTLPENNDGMDPMVNYVKSGHPTDENGSGEHWKRSEVAPTLNTFENAGSVRANVLTIGCPNGQAVCATLIASDEAAVGTTQDAKVLFIFPETR